MINKGLDADSTLIKTPSFVVAEEKPLNHCVSVNKDIKVDINVLIARAQEIQNKSNKKNILTFVFLLAILAVLGAYLSS